MTRIKRGTVVHKRHKKILKQTKGMRGRIRTNFKLAKVAALKAKIHAYRDRKLKKADFRSLWIARMNAALRMEGLKYSTFIKKLKDKKIILNRKVLSNLAAQYPEVFKKIVEIVK